MQILNLGDSDFYRTRLTHSLEVAQIAGGLVEQLRFNEPNHIAVPYVPEHGQIQAIACTHDLGHPPFGHGGEVALNYCMRDAGGFEGMVRRYAFCRGSKSSHRAVDQT